VEVTTTSNQRAVTTVAATGLKRKLDDKDVRMFLLGAVIIEFAVILLIVTNAAASTVTREKEDGSLDLLLSTPITSRYYIWGKLRGLVSFVLPLVAVPVISVTVFILYDTIRCSARRAGGGELQVDRVPRGDPDHARDAGDRRGVCGDPGDEHVAALPHDGARGDEQRRNRRRRLRRAGLVRLPDAPPGQYGQRAGPDDVVVQPVHRLNRPHRPIFARRPDFRGRVAYSHRPFIILFVSWVATALYALIVWSMYKAMVKNFDMTIRRQSR
jgi:hypothetical protein